MPHATTIAIAWCILGFASSDMEKELGRKIQTTEAQDCTSKDPRNLHSTVTDDKMQNLHEREVALQRFDSTASRSGFLTQLQTDERFWRTYRDFDADADDIRAWKEFQIVLAGRN